MTSRERMQKSKTSEAWESIRCLDNLKSFLKNEIQDEQVLGKIEDIRLVGVPGVFNKPQRMGDHIDLKTIG